MSDIESGNDDGGGPDLHDDQPPRGRPRLVAFGFLLAFAATVLTVILTGLMLRHG